MENEAPLTETPSDETPLYKDHRPTFAQQAARASIFAPFISVALTIFGNVALNQPSSQMQRPIIGLIALLIVLIGLICAIVGLCGVKKLLGINKRRGGDLLIISIIGLVLNGVILYFAISATLHLHKILSGKLTVTPPATFKEFPEGLKGVDNVIHAYIKGNPSDNESDILILIIDLGGLIARNSDVKDTLGKRGDTSFFEEKWKSHQIDVARIEGEINGTSFLEFDAPVPTAPKAVLVKIVGPQDKENEIKKYLQEMLKGVEGPSNW